MTQPALRREDLDLNFRLPMTPGPIKPMTAADWDGHTAEGVSVPGTAVVLVAVLEGAEKIETSLTIKGDLPNDGSVKVLNSEQAIALLEQHHSMKLQKWLIEAYGPETQQKAQICGLIQAQRYWNVKVEVNNLTTGGSILASVNFGSARQ